MKFGFGSDVLDAAVRLFIPPILLFALYVVVHGHYSPGGGFQGGTLLAAAVIVVNLVRGPAVTWGPTGVHSLKLAVAGVGFYAAIGFAALLAGGNFLDYGVLPLGDDVAAVRALGTLGIEIGVTFGVMGVMLLIFDALLAPADD